MRCCVEMFGRPVGSQRPELVADIEADMIAFFEYDKVRRARRGACETLAFCNWNKFIARAVHDEHRAFNLLRHAFQREAACNLMGFGECASMAPHTKSFL